VRDEGRFFEWQSPQERTRVRIGEGVCENEMAFYIFSGVNVSDFYKKAFYPPL